MTNPYRSEILEALAADAEALAQALAASGLGPRQVAALADEELRLVDQLGGGEKYASLRAFLAALRG